MLYGITELLWDIKDQFVAYRCAMGSFSWWLSVIQKRSGSYLKAMKTFSRSIFYERSTSDYEDASCSQWLWSKMICAVPTLKVKGNVYCKDQNSANTYKRLCVFNVLFQFYLVTKSVSIQRNGSNCHSRSLIQCMEYPCVSLSKICFKIA